MDVSSVSECVGAAGSFCIGCELRCYQMAQVEGCFYRNLRLNSKQDTSKQVSRPSQPLSCCYRPAELHNIIHLHPSPAVPHAWRAERKKMNREQTAVWTDAHLIFSYLLMCIILN